MWSVLKISADDWVRDFAESAHRAVFNELMPAYRHRISYALLIIKHGEGLPPEGQVIGYVTVREYDDETVYWQFGGVFPTYRKSMTAVKCIENALSWQRQHSKRIVTYVENKNLPMLRLWLSYGFIVIGTRTYNGSLMLDLIKELQ